MTSVQCTALETAITKAGLTSASLAKKTTNLTEGRINEIRGGDEPTAQEFQSIASVLGLNLTDLPHHGNKAA